MNVLGSFCQEASNRMNASRRFGFVLQEALKNRSKINTGKNASATICTNVWPRHSCLCSSENTRKLLKLGCRRNRVFSASGVAVSGYTLRFAILHNFSVSGSKDCDE